MRQKFSTHNLTFAEFVVLKKLRIYCEYIGWMTVLLSGIQWS